MVTKINEKLPLSAIIKKVTPESQAQRKEILKNRPRFINLILPRYFYWEIISHFYLRLVIQFKKNLRQLV